MTNRKIVFRLDADPHIGTGHLMRCLTLAKALSGKNCECLFLCPLLSDELQKQVYEQGHQLHLFSSRNDELNTLKQLSPDWLIVDHYGLDAQWEQTAKPYVRQIFVIDDLADRSHECDLLLDQGPLRTNQDYQTLVPQQCKVLLGPAYAMIKQTYLHQQKVSVTAFNKGLICFGGADPAHATLTTLQTLIPTNFFQQHDWTIVAGSANPDWPQLLEICSHYSQQMKLLRHSNNMAELMTEHDFSIGAAGGMTWERCCIGLPSLVIPIADNQKFNSQVLAHFGLCEQLNLLELSDPEKLIESLQRLAIKADSYCQKGKQFIDGHGIQRIVQELTQRTTRERL